MIRAFTFDEGYIIVLLGLILGYPYFGKLLHFLRDEELRVGGFPRPKGPSTQS